jgi:hypothetical protein
MGTHLPYSAPMSLIDSLPRFLFPTRRRGERWLRELLRELGVRAPLSPGCLQELVMSAAEAAETTRSADETYASALRKQVAARAQFVHHWTNTDDSITDPQLSELIAIARKHLLPRSWSIAQTSVMEIHRDHSFTVPERLIVKGPRSGNAPGAAASAGDLPGEEILSDLKRAGDKS